jgi:hypothetical protein
MAPTRTSQAENELASPLAPLPQPAVGSVRRQLMDQLLAMGADDRHAERVAEAAIRRAKAQREHRVFYYADAEYELEDLYRGVGASVEVIESAKQTVWTTARETAGVHGCSMEEALFFCFHEAADVYREFLAAGHLPG